MSSPLFSNFFLRVFLVSTTIFFTCAEGRPLPPTVHLHLPAWLQGMVPKKGATIADEIKCYSLPYGGIGFLSHILTYWTIFWLGHGRKPYFPFSKLSAGKFDIFLSLTQIVVTISIAGFTISRCRSRWQFVLIAVWKLMMSLVVGIWGLNAASKARQGKQSDSKIWDGDGWPITLGFYGVAMAVGLVGLISLVVEHISNPMVWKVTAAFGAVIAFIGLVVLILAWIGLASEREEGCGLSSAAYAVTGSVLGAIPGLMVVLGAFYSDWILGALAGALLGFPSEDSKELYWAYFAAKRLPFFLT